VKRLVFSSSSEVYGIPTKFPTPESEPLVVPDPLNPRWSYGGSKIIGELAIANAARLHGFEFTILRYHNVYGPRMGSDHVIPQFIRRLELGEEFTVQGDGEQRRSFCYIDDAVAVTVVSALEPRAAGAILNIGNPAEEVSINDLVRSLSRIAGKHIEPRYVPFEGEGTRRRLPDISRARELLGFEPSIRLEDGLQRTYAWYAQSFR
jgi:nucleoside-diphosphate-sugar epimerase